jgi:tol-pal system protein YbgF
MHYALLPLLGAAALAVSLVAQPAAAQSTKDRLESLERAVTDLQSQSAAARESALRISRLEQEIQRLTGRIEELTHQLDRANARLETMSLALAGEAGTGPVAGGPTPLSGEDPIGARIAEATGEEAEIALPFDPDEAFSYASAFLLRGDYARARKAFELYLEAFPSHARAAEARFRLGEIYLATGANAEAADAFIDHIRRHPNDPRAAEVYLKLGTAFARLGQTQEACQVFRTMKSRYANAAPAVMQRADLEMSRINCR